MNGFHLPRGRFTDALVALSVFVALLVTFAFTVGTAMPVPIYVFSPVGFLGGGSSDPLYWLSPLTSAFVPDGIVNALFNFVFLLIAGRFVEHRLGPVGLITLFVAGAYGGALARLALTSGSMAASMGIQPSLFAIIGAYFMLYGVPAALPVPRHLGRMAQVATLALFWLVIQAIGSLVGGSFEVSVTFVDPIGGLLAGIALAQPLAKWLDRAPKGPTSRWR